jgi:hypothetical protein
MNKIIFLDLDGVLRVGYCGRDEFGQLFVDYFVDNLKYIIEQTNAKIVISSDWKSSGLSVLKDMWIKRNLPGEVIDITPNAVDIVNFGICEFYDLVDRGHEIQQYINENNIEKYVILDDIPDFLPSQMNNYIKTSYNHHHIDSIDGFGLTRKCAEKAIKILNKK